MGFANRDIISISDFTKKEILHILKVSARMQRRPPKGLLQGRIMATMFFEPSTRTRLSFEAAMHRLGGKVLGFAEAATTSISKGESFTDTIRMGESYADCIVIRHPLEGAARLAAEAVSVPIINGGDGANQHPTQTFLDLYTIQKTQNHVLEKNKPLRIGFAGDLKYGRTVHSLTIALSHFSCRLYFISPKSLEISPHYIRFLEEHRVPYSIHREIEEVINDLDILYATRIQEERFPDPLEYARVKNAYVIRRSMLQRVKSNFQILHPLPRVNEVDRDIDETPYAAYFHQAANAVPVRQAVLSLVLGAIS